MLSPTALVGCTCCSPDHTDVGVWATLQFKWVQLQYPVVVLAFEKLLIGCSLPVAATVQAWGVIAGLGLAPTPFYLTPILGVLYCLFGMPLASSFTSGPRRNSIGQSLMCNMFACMRTCCDGAVCFGMVLCVARVSAANAAVP